MDDAFQQMNKNTHHLVQETSLFEQQQKKVTPVPHSAYHQIFQIMFTKKKFHVYWFEILRSMFIA